MSSVTSGLDLSFKRNTLSVLLLTAIFLASFSIPIVFVLKVAGLRTPTSQEREDSLFPATATIRGSGSVIQIPHSEVLQPIVGKDFLVLSWFRLNDLPLSEDRHIFLLKYDGETEKKPGYGLAVSRGDHGVRAEIYWRGEDGSGGWYKFPEFSLLPNAWCLLALSFRDGKYLGLHSSLLLSADKPEVKLLGGYDVSENSLPISSSPLLYGAPEHSLFQGRLGPLLILHPKDLSESLKDVLKKIAADPGVARSLFRTKDVALSIENLREDSSPHEHTVSLHKVKVK